MTDSQRENAELLKALGRPADVIAVNTGLPLEAVRAWLRTGRWPVPRQMTLFDRDGYSPRPETAQPVATDERDHGSRVFAAAGGQNQPPSSTHSGQEQYE